MRRFLAAVFLLVMVWPAGATELDTIRGDADPQRRYRAALDYAAQQITASRKAYEDGKVREFEAALGEVVAGVKLCDETLRAPGRNRVRNATHFKKAELKTREILRRLDQLGRETGVDDRAPVEKAKTAVQAIQDRLLLDITGRRPLGG